MKTKIKILYFIFNWMIFFSLFNIYGFSMTNPKGGGGLSYSGRLGINMFGEFEGSPDKEKHVSGYFISFGAPFTGERNSKNTYTQSELTFDDILKGNHSQKYITTKKDSPNMGFTFSTFWVKFTITNQSEKSSLYYFIYEFPGIDKITLYQKLRGEWVSEVSGDQIPASKKKINHRFFPFKIYPKESSTYYLQIKNTTVI